MKAETMTQVDMSLVKELRDRTQAKLNDCRKAVLESDGDLDKALEYIQKKGLADSVKRAGKVAAEGVVLAAVSEINPVNGAIVEVNTQTDFAARNPDFLAFADKVVQTALGGGRPMETLEDERVALVAKLGENIVIRRWERLARISGEVVAYNHPGGKIAVLVDADQGGAALQDVAMQVAAMNPLYLSPSQVPDHAYDAQEEIFKAQLKEEGKVPEDKWPRVLEGKMKKWFKEVCLLEQPSVIESKKTVAQVLESQNITLKGFTRFERGDGIEKEDDGDFASEVAAMASKP